MPRTIMFKASEAKERTVNKTRSTGPQKLTFSLLQPSEMALLSNSRWQNRKERPNRSTNNGDIGENAKHSVIRCT